MRSLLIFCLLCCWIVKTEAQNTTVRITLFDQNRFDNGLSASDGLLIAFEAGNNNGVDSFDAPKIFNLDESFARQNGTNLLSIERRDIPVDNETLPFFITNYRTQDYVFEVTAFQLPGFLCYIEDLYTGEIFEMGTGQTEVTRFSIDNSIPESIDVNRFQMTFMEQSDYIYDNTWINLDPCIAPIAATDNLSILSGTAIIDCDAVLNNLAISNGATLQIESGRTVTINGEVYNSGAIEAQDATVVLNGSSSVFSASAQLGNLTVTDNNNIELAGLFDVYGTLKHSGTSASVVDNSNANITFKSSVNRNAYFIPTDVQLTAPVVSETYMSAKRAYRFLSSPVTSSGSIYENWQENGDESIVGFGTDITGTAGASAGFDVTGTNNSSMFEWDNAGQNWTAQTSTNNASDIIETGKPYRLFIRGDRQVDLTTNADAQRETVLRTRGLFANTIPTPVINTTDGAFNMIGNPFLAPYDLNGMLSNLNMGGVPVDAPSTRPTFFYVWDPTIQTNGAYVTYDVMANMNNMTISEVNGYLQPYQAAFVVANGSAGSFNFNEAFLDDNQGNVQVSSTPTIMRVELSKNGHVKDGALIKFDATYSNQLDLFDATKLANLEENLSVKEGIQLTSINSRNYPVAGEIIPLHVEQLTSGTYSLSLSPLDFSNLDAFLVDNFLGQTTPLDRTTITSYTFDWDTLNFQSSDAARLQIEFLNSTLSVDESAFAKAVTIYPNPSKSRIINVTLPEVSRVQNIDVYNTLGQMVKTFKTLDQNNQLDLSSLTNGVYLVRFALDERLVTKRVILE
ncbi:putative secreted protein (Por secretion system target) [Nonlabens dokdonensis]|uniref:Carboxypeptidase T n=2 Tax=Nonlabens dokdonensis TaxID=328515 RepID=L7WAD3_NONDD|nr:T9SS type A sorting domain-containing protein [Nonlabens dokdonensis]AGC77177.1 carboxypeptidase T [Nonlabens dokdonensis DSW-6]PZX41135.1 putative secreted protein (Por secretion system target) [Nonlabens dokdonensis]